MSATPESFQNLASGLFVRFGAFKADAVITRSGDFDYSTQSASETTQTVGMIRTEFKESLIDGNLIKAGDYKLIGLYSDFEFVPSADTDSLIHKTIDLDIKDVGIDAADAAITLHVRRK